MTGVQGTGSGNYTSPLPRCMKKLFSGKGSEHLQLRRPAAFSYSYRTDGQGERHCQSPRTTVTTTDAHVDYNYHLR